jgi:hypothetical protein
MKQKGPGLQWDRPFRDPFVLPPHSDPYEELREFGVTFNSSMDDVHECFKIAQKQREVTAAREQAYQTLRRPEKRLLIDFLYFQPDPTAFGLDEPSLPPVKLDELLLKNDEAGTTGIGSHWWQLLLEAWEPNLEELPPLPLPQPLSDSQEE